MSVVKKQSPVIQLVLTQQEKEWLLATLDLADTLGKQFLDKKPSPEAETLRLKVERAT